MARMIVGSHDYVTGKYRLSKLKEVSTTMDICSGSGSSYCLDRGFRCRGCQHQRAVQ